MHLLFRRCTLLTDEALYSIASKMPKSITSFSLKLTSCENMTAMGVARLSGSLPFLIKSYSIWLDYCSCVEDAREIINKMFDGRETEVHVFGALIVNQASRAN